MTARRGAALGILVLAIAAAVVARSARRGSPDAAPVVHAPSPIPRVRLAELRHQEPSSIAGTVTAAGAAVASATVCARASDDTAAEPSCTQSGADGTWELAELPPAAYVIWASAAGSHGAATAVTTAAGEHRGGVELVLLAGAVPLRGLVRDVRGGPIAAAVLQIGRDANAPPTYIARTGADGAFDAWAVPGDVHLAVSAEGYVDDELSTVAPDPAIAIMLTPAGAISGTVVDATTHAAIADANVDVGGEHARSDAAGRFRVGKLRPGRYKPTASSIGGYGEAAESLRLGLAETRDGVVIEIHPVAVVAGHVMIDDTAGALRPCAAELGEVWLTRHGSAASYLAKTLDDGQVLLEGVVPGTYEVSARCKGWVSAAPYPDLVVGDSDVDDVVWKVSRGVRVIGRVRARGGELIAGARINVHSTDDVSFASTTSGSDGEFEVGGLGSGTSIVDASAEGFLPADPSVDVVASASAPGRCEIVLDRGGTIAGVVVDAQGAPASGARVARSAPGPDDASVMGTHADRAGAFRFEALAPGTYRVAVESELGERADAAHSVQAVVAAGETTAVRVIASAPSGALDGRVVDGAGAAVTDAYVEVALEDETVISRTGAVRHAWTTPAQLVALDGGFHFAELPAGFYGVRASRPGGGETVVARVALGSRITIALRPTGVLAGTVVSATGAPVTDVVVTAEDRAHGISRDERVYFTGGRFALRDLPAGSYKLTVDNDPGSALAVELADAEDREDLRLVVQPRFTLRGRLVSSHGAPLVGWRVQVPQLERVEHGPGTSESTVSMILIAITTADGAFAVHDLPADPTTISAYDPNGAPDAKAVLERDVTMAGTAPVVDVGAIALP